MENEQVLIIIGALALKIAGMFSNYPVTPQTAVQVVKDIIKETTREDN